MGLSAKVYEIRASTGLDTGQEEMLFTELGYVVVVFSFIDISAFLVQLVFTFQELRIAFYNDKIISREL